MAVATTLLAAGLDWGTLTGHGSTVVVTHVGLSDAATGGTEYIRLPIGGSTPYSVAVADGGSVQIPMNGLSIRCLGANGATVPDALAIAILDEIFGHTTLGPSVFYARLYKADGTEFPTSGNYVAQVTTTIFSNNTGNFPGASMV